MTFETPDDVLEHFGVKGMRWGVRNQRSSSSGKSGVKKKNASKKKRAAQIAVVGGIAVAGVILAHRGGVRINSLSRAPQTLSGLSTKGSQKITRDALRSQNVMRKVVERSAAQRIGNIPGVGATPRRPRVTKSAANDISALRSSIASSIRGANAELRSRDNDLNIPIHQRQYLTEWD